MTRDELSAKWEHRAAEWARLGVLVNGAQLAAEILEDLHELEAKDADETLTLTDAAKELDMHPDSIGRAIRQGRLPNCGRPNAPRVRRGDLEALGRRGRAKATPTSISSAARTSFGAITRDAIASKVSTIRRG